MVIFQWTLILRIEFSATSKYVIWSFPTSHFSERWNEWRNAKTLQQSIRCSSYAHDLRCTARPNLCRTNHLFQSSPMNDIIPFNTFLRRKICRCHTDIFLVNGPFHFKDHFISIFSTFWLIKHIYCVIFYSSKFYSPFKSPIFALRSS